MTRSMAIAAPSIPRCVERLLTKLPPDRRVDGQAWRSLQAFRRAHAPRATVVRGERWEYVAVGQGASVLLFLHGSAGGLDIWWQQIERVATCSRVIAVSYPAVPDLASMRQGIMAILDLEGVRSVRVVGSSLGGYIAQYLMSTDPDRIEAAVLTNSFAPNELLEREHRRRVALLTRLPQRLYAWSRRRILAKQMCSTARPSELVLAYLTEHTGDKRQVMARYRCALDRFEPPNPTGHGIPVLIIESDDDPLIPRQLREQLKATYPSAQVQTLPDGGHFPYLSQPELYTALVERFLSTAPHRRVAPRALMTI